MLIKTMKNLLYILLVIDLCLAKTVTISGSIFNDEGKPSRKAEVTLLAIDGYPITMMKTNRRGRFEFPEIIPDAPEILSTEEVLALLESPSLDHYLGLRDRTMMAQTRGSPFLEPAVVNFWNPRVSISGCGCSCLKLSLIHI